VVLLATLSFIHTSVLRRHNGKFSQKRKSNILHAHMFCVTNYSTGHTVKGARSRDSHK